MAIIGNADTIVCIWLQQNSCDAEITLPNICLTYMFFSRKYDMVHVWVDAGITEALDDIQVCMFTDFVEY